MAIKVGDIQLFMGSKELNAPDNLLQVVVDYIDNAKKKLLIAIQEIDNREITEAIIRAKKRDVIVKIVVEGDYLKEKKVIYDSFKLIGENEANRVLQNALLRTSIDVRSDYNEGIFHQKFIVRDSKAILTGSTNFTDTDTSVNLNNILIIDNSDIAKQFENEYKEIQQGHFGKLNEGHDEKPAEVEVSKIRIKTLFAPDHNPEMEIMKQIAKAKNRVDFAIFTFAQSSGIDDQLVFAKKANIKINGALFSSQANQKWASTKILSDAGITFSIVPGEKAKGSRLRKLHHKIMVIDEQLVITGSFNYTGAANKLNDENIIVIGDLDSIDEESIVNQKKIAKFVLSEIERIIRDFS